VARKQESAVDRTGISAGAGAEVPGRLVIAPRVSLGGAVRQRAQIRAIRRALGQAPG
jgi:hypothetical protein